MTGFWGGFVIGFLVGLFVLGGAYLVGKGWHRDDVPTEGHKDPRRSKFWRPGR